MESCLAVPATFEVVVFPTAMIPSSTPEDVDPFLRAEETVA